MQNLGENHETIQQLTSQLEEMQERMNSRSVGSGDFQEVESNYCGRFSHVSSQLVMIPSSRSMLSRDKRLPLGFLVIDFLRLIHPEIILKEFVLAHHKENEDQFLKPQGRRLFSHEMTNKIDAQFQCRHLQEGRRQ